MKDLKDEALSVKDAVIACRRRLHSFAECGFSLPKTISFVKNALQNIGFEPIECGKGGLICEIGSVARPKAPAVLLRADMDALPLKEETNLPFRAENGHMHACGHDMHTAMLLGAAAILKKREGALPVPVRLVFEGAEETLSGAKDLCDAGVLSGVGAALMLHAVTAVPFPTGTVLLPPSGISAPAAAFFEIELIGKSAHVGEESLGADALSAAVCLYLEVLRAKEEMGEDFFLSVGRWTAGDAPNVVPQRAVLSGSFRTRNEEKLEHFRKRLKELCEKPKDGVTSRLRFQGGCPPLKSDMRCISAMNTALEGAGFAHHKVQEAKGNASEDFATFAALCPSVALALAAGEKGHGYEHPLHHPRVLFDEDALPIGAAVYALGAFALGDLLQTFTSPSGA